MIPIPLFIKTIKDMYVFQCFLLAPVPPVILSGLVHCCESEQCRRCQATEGSSNIRGRVLSPPTGSFPIRLLQTAQVRALSPQHAACMFISL